MNWKPSLRTVLLIVHLIVFAIPLLAIGGLRIYESELVRRTEAELISQGAMVQAAYKRELITALDEVADTPAARSGRRQVPEISEYGHPTDLQWPRKVEEWLKPVPASLDLSDEPVGPEPPEPRPADQPADPWALQAGEAVAPLMQDAQQITLSGMQIVDYRGTIVATTGQRTGATLAHRDEVARALDGEFVQKLRQRISDEAPPPLDSISRRTGVRVFVTMPIAHSGRLLGAVVLSRTPMSLLKAVYKHRYMFGAALLITLLGVISISVITSLFIGQPIRALIRQTESIAANEGEHSAAEPIESPGTREFDQLSEAFARMARTLEQRADYIRTFAQNVSHEFKTPLSSIRGTVELLRDHWETMDDRRRERFLSMLEADRQRLQTLVERLLDLARADTLEPGEASCRLDDVLDELVERFDGGELSVAVDAPDDAGDLSARVAMSTEALSSVLSNLLENAREHGGSRVDITVRRVEADKDGAERVQIMVQDDGQGISEGNAEKVFEAFFTTARDEGGTGLGLSIVQSIVQAHDGTIELKDGGDGAVFELEVRSTK